MFQLLSNIDTTNKIGVMISGLGFITSITSIDVVIKIIAGCIAIVAGLYTILYTHLKIKNLKNNNKKTD